MSLTKSNRNCSLDIFRYFCSVLVVAIHTKPLMDVNDELGIVFSEIIPRIAVPFFFCVSGYFYIQRIEKGMCCITFIKKVLLTYGIWSVPYLVRDFFQWGIQDFKSFLFNCIYSFFIEGSHYHFWFFPALIYSMIAYYIFYKVKIIKLILPLSLLFYAVGTISCAYYQIGMKIPVLNFLYSFPKYDVIIRRFIFMGFPFFVSGYFIWKINNRVSNKYNQKFYLLIIFIFLILWAFEILIVFKLKLQSSVVTTFFLYPLLIAIMIYLLKFPNSKLQQMSNRTSVMANIMYYIHPLFIYVALYICNVIGVICTESLLFILVVLSTSIVGFIISCFNNKVVDLLK